MGELLHYSIDTNFRINSRFKRDTTRRYKTDSKIGAEAETKWRYFNLDKHDEKEESGVLKDIAWNRKSHREASAL